MTIEGYKRKALVDSGCNRSMIRSYLASCQRSPTKLPDCSEGQIMIVSAIVTNKLVGDIDFILGMDVIRRVGGITISSSGVTFLSSKLDGRVSLQNQNKTNEKVVMNEGKAQD
ncbi:hypothetical protein GJ496_011888 [Pomphorhynchus laevis]|nr:hypothetical protein GJ496_011888 [Pomphorhynchus laevis]